MGDKTDMEQMMNIDCGGVLDISSVAQWHAQAQSTLQTASEIHLKADELQRIDAAGLQAVLCLFLSAQQRGITIHWDSPSPALLQAASLTGLNEQLALA